MSKPNTPGELRNVRVEAISLVSKAANRKTFKIFKSAAKTPPLEGAPATVTQDERGLFSVLKSFFSSAEVEKGELADKYNARERARQLGIAVDALWSTLKYNRWGEDNEKAVTDPKVIRAALADFKEVAEEILISKDDEIVKIAAEVRKSGRKIAGARLAEIKAAHAALAKIIEETDQKTEGDANEVTKEELMQVVKGAVDEAVKPLGERLEKLEKGDGEENTPADGDAAKQDGGPDVTAVVKDALAEAMATLSERLDKVEKARGISNKIAEEAAVRKDGDDLWGDLL